MSMRQLTSFEIIMVNLSFNIYTIKRLCTEQFYWGRIWIISMSTYTFDNLEIILLQIEVWVYMTDLYTDYLYGS